QPAHLDALRQAAFAITPIKELSVIGADGQTICTDLGPSRGNLHTVSWQRVARQDDVLIEVVRIGDRKEPMVRVRRPNIDGAATLAALIPSDILMLQASAQSSPFNAYAELMLRDGTPIGILGAERAERTEQDRFTATATSERYDLVAMVSKARASVAVS